MSINYERSLIIQLLIDCKLDGKLAPYISVAVLACLPNSLIVE